jgi:DNA-binding NarL/FixJ family response regulator
MGIIKVLVAEPDPLRLKGITTSLTQEVGFEVAGIGSDFIEALKADSLPFSPPDVLIINIDHQPMKRMKSWALLRSLLPEVRIVALTTGKDALVLEAALAAGVKALHPTDVEPDTICRAARNAVKGGIDYDSSLVERIKEILVAPFEEAPGEEMDNDYQPLRIRSRRKRLDLTPREEEVLRLMAKGYDNDRIATLLSITKGTVRNHVSNLYSKLGAGSRAEAVAWAWMHGMAEG